MKNIKKKPQVNLFLSIKNNSIRDLINIKKKNNIYHCQICLT